MDKLMSDALLWTPTHGHTSVGRKAKINIHHLCADTEYRLENWTSLIGMDREKERQRQRQRDRERGGKGIRAISAPRCWL